MKASVIELPVPAKPKRRARRSAPVYLTPEELLRLLRSAKEHNAREWCMILLAYRHGLRASEVCGLKMEDLNLKDGQVIVRRLKNSLQTTQPIYQHRGQPLLDERKALRAWMRERKDDGSGFVFTSQKGGRLDRTQFFRIFKSLAEKAGLPANKAHPHLLKHSLATHLVLANVNLALVRQACGHRSISSTVVYTQISDSQAATAVSAALQDLF